MTRHECQRERRSAKVFDGDDDMVILYAELDRLAGERVRTALNELSDRIFRKDSEAGSDRTHAQRNADALVALITQQPAHPESSSGNDAASDDSDGEIAPQATTLIVSVDYDVLCGQLENAGLIDGTPIDIDELRHIACDAGIVPVIFASDGQPLYMGRKQRAATAAQKMALYFRDKQCIGCGMRASACEAHHITWWDNNGPTDITNLVLLCPKCHKKVHRHGYVVGRDRNGHYQLRLSTESKVRRPDDRGNAENGFQQKALSPTKGQPHQLSAVLSGR